MAKIEYSPLNLPKPLVEELKIWRMAFCLTYGKTVSYGEMIRSMLDSLPETDPDVLDSMTALVQHNPALSEKLGNYRSLAGQDGEE